MSLRAWVILQSIVLVLGILPAFGVQMASVMGGASAGDLAIGKLVAILGLVFPFFLIGALLALWLCYALGLRALTIGCIAAPWLYLAALAISLVVMFRSAAA